jgi:hypothetical protein
MELWKQTGYTPSTVQVSLTAPAAVAGLSQKDVMQCQLQMNDSFEE